MRVGEKETAITFDKKQQFIQNFPPICSEIIDIYFLISNGVGASC